jgi:outer membrane protein, heavy metal efflux system
MPAVLRQAPGIVSWCLFMGVFLALFTPAPAQAKAPELMFPSVAPLTLPEAHAQALQYHPDLSAYAEEIRAREAEAVQAGLRPNPVLSLEAENVLGSGEFTGTDAAETTISLSQPIELGNKRIRRRELAEAEIAVAGSDFAQTRADVLAKTTESFITVLAAQERLKLADEMSALAGQILVTVEERIEAGKAPATERLRANIQRREQEVARDRAQRSLSAARSALAARMGLETAAFGPVSGALSPLPDLPLLRDLEAAIADSPSVSRWVSETERRRRALALKRAEKIPDVEVSLGARHLRENDDTALVLGVSIPLPVFNRNQGGIAAARSRHSQTRAQERGELLQAKAVLAATWQDFAAAREEAEALDNEIIPDARKTLEAVEYGYRAGKFAILDILDAQRTLIELQGRHLDALAAGHRAAAELNRLLGPDLPKSGTPVSVTVSSRE